MFDMLANIEKMREIASFIHDNSNDDMLDSMQRALEEKKYLISVIGQFSAGKSRLINNLLCREVLPVHITETTAVITLIKYGDEEYAEVTYKDGHEEKISISQSLELWQSGAKDKLAQVEAITIYLINDLLMGDQDNAGMIIADTPGINTIINEHVRLTTEILSNSEKVIYVMGKSLTDSDVKFIKKIKDSGLSILFVRTHMDEINLTEESYEQAIEKEKSALSDLTDDRIFFVSNIENNRFSDEVNVLRDYLQNNLSNHVQEAIEESCKLKLAMAAEDYKNKLAQQKKSFMQLAEGRQQEYSQSKKKISDAMAMLDKQMTKRTERSKEICIEAERDAKEAIEGIVKKYKNKIDKEITEITAGSEPENYEEIVNDNVSDCYADLQQSFLDSLEKILGENQNEIKEILDNNVPEMELDKYLPEDMEESQEQLQALNEIIALNEQYQEEIEAADESIDELKRSNKQIDQNLAAAHQNLEDVKRELSEYPAYEAQYNVIQEASNKKEAIMGKIGGVLDWATLFLPGKAMVTVAGKTVTGAAKVATKLGASKNVINKINKVGKTLTKGKKALEAAQKVDMVMDGVKVTREVVNAQDESSPLKILNYFTLEHWFRQIGKRFDHGEIIEIDKEYELEYNEKKSEIERRVNESVEEEMKQRTAMNKNMSEIRRLEMEKNLHKKKQKEAEQQLKKLMEKNEKDRIKRIHEKMCKYYSDYGSEFINNMAETITKQIHETLPKYIELYISAENVSIMQKLAKQKHDLEILEKEFENTSKEQIRIKISEYEKYDSYLKKMIG